MQAVKAIVRNRVIREILSMAAFSVHVFIHSAVSALTKMPVERKAVSVPKASALA